MSEIQIHNFHIPVMGLAYTIDSPVKVARYGINSAISIIEDNLIEVMRKYYFEKSNMVYNPITSGEEDHRARRITDYLNLVNKIVQEQFEKLRKSAFEVGSDIVKYFEMLPDGSELKQLYNKMSSSCSKHEKSMLQQLLRSKVRPGSIEVNIMTKLDKNNFNGKEELLIDGSDALCALRGYARSGLKDSAVIFSAGMNPRLFNYLEEFTAFDPVGWGNFEKRIIVKVSDFRSALIQGKYLAKKGFWVSEFRIESGLNCGGHAFATDGMLLGPILEEFKTRRDELVSSLFELYNPAAKKKGKQTFDEPHPVSLTVQGGIGTGDEHNLLHHYYKVNSTGWGTPFLLCPEATTVDDETFDLLRMAEEKDVILSTSSPLGVRFNYLKGTSGEKERLERIAKGKPGSPCTEKFLVSNTEFTKEPICTASRKYQKLKIEQLQNLQLPQEEYQRQADEVLSKECLCIGLSNSAPLRYKQPFVKNLSAVTICPGPNIVNFSKKVSLQEMVDHIYGRSNIIRKKERPHMFIRELQLYISYIYEEFEQNTMDGKFNKYCRNFCMNLLQGIQYYKDMLHHYHIPANSHEAFARGLTDASVKLQELMEKIPNGYSDKI